MKISKISTAAMLSSVLAVSACTDPGSLGGDPSDPKRNTKASATVGAAAGAVLGAIVGGKDDRVKGALVGAAVGGAVGAGVGYSLDRQEAELRASVGSGVTITNTGDRLIVTLPQDILFDTGSFAVRAGLRGDLGAVAASLKTYPGSTIQVVGHTDADGEASYNQELSERRANAVADVLMENGVPFSRIQAFGRGEAQPIASNLSPEGKAQNRRVEIVILPSA